MKTYRYHSFSDDFAETKNQDYKLPKDYKWLHNNPFYRLAAILFYPFVIIFALIYSKLILRIKIKNKSILKGHKSYFIYSNHTLELGDVLNPFLINYHRPKILCSPANLGIPVIGKLLPLAGALPIPNGVHALIKFNSAVKHHAKTHPIVIYPEAHLWPYYTKIRPFPKSAFSYPTETNSPVFTATTVYKKPKKPLWKPIIEIYLDGPFLPDSEKSKKQNAAYLHDQVSENMQSRAKNSNYEYIKYKRI